MKNQIELENQLEAILGVLKKRNSTINELLIAGENFKSFIPDYTGDMRIYIGDIAFLSLYAERTVEKVKKLASLGISGGTRIEELHGTAILTQENFKKICGINFDNFPGEAL